MVVGGNGGRSARPRRRAVWLAVALGIAVVALAAPFVRKGVRGTSELPVYTTAAERMWERAEIYRHSDSKPFTYPPFFAIPFMPMPGVPEQPPRPAAPIILWYLINIGVLAGLIAIVHRRLRIGTPPVSPLWFWVLTAVLAGRHVNSVFENQSHDLLVFLLCALGIDAYCQSREARAGGWIGVAAACKATPLLFGVPWVLQRRVVTMTALAVAALGATLLPDLLFPRPDGQLWVVAWYETFLTAVRPGETATDQSAWSAASILNQSLSGTLHRLLTTGQDAGDFVRYVTLFDPGETGRKVITLAASAAVLAIIALAAWPSHSRGLTPEQLQRRRFGEGSAVLCGMVLLSPMSSKSHFCVLLFPIAFCVWQFLANRKDLALGAMLVGMFVLGPLTMKGVAGHTLGTTLLSYGAVTWTTVITLLATAHVLWWYERAGATPPDGGSSKGETATTCV